MPTNEDQKILAILKDERFIWKSIEIRKIKYNPHKRNRKIDQLMRWVETNHTNDKRVLQHVFHLLTNMQANEY